jgi:hypothetical protein
MLVRERGGDVVSWARWRFLLGLLGLAVPWREGKRESGQARPALLLGRTREGEQRRGMGPGPRPCWAAKSRVGESEPEGRWESWAFGSKHRGRGFLFLFSFLLFQIQFKNIFKGNLNHFEF